MAWSAGVGRDFKRTGPRHRNSHPEVRLTRRTMVHWEIVFGVLHMFWRGEVGTREERCGGIAYSVTLLHTLFHVGTAFNTFGYVAAAESPLCKSVTGPDAFSGFQVLQVLTLDMGPLKSL